MPLRALRGQVEAPIELFVAVIILAMSMALAFYVINTTGEAQCLAEMRSQVRSLESAMADVAIGSPPTSRQATFYMKACGTKRVEGIRFVKYASPEFCRACPGYTAGCWKIEPVYVDPGDGKLKPVDEASLCVEMPMDIGVEDEYNPVCPGGTVASPCFKDTKCIPLNDEPCPSEVGGCKPDIPRNVWDDQYWRTLGKAGGESFFVLKLTKRVYLGYIGGVPGQKSYIGVCAKTKEMTAGG